MIYKKEIQFPVRHTLVNISFYLDKKISVDMSLLSWRNKIRTKIQSKVVTFKFIRLRRDSDFILAK